MSRVLLVCPEPLGHRHPAGIGIRFLEFARALVADGHEVMVLSPDGGEVAGCCCEKTSATAIAQQSRRSDVAVVQGHVANELFAHGAPVPTVVDLYDPFIIENFHYRSLLGERVFLHDHATLMRSLHEGDFFLCASEDQRLFYLGALLAAGRLNPATFAADPTLEKTVAIVPFGVPPPRDLRSRKFVSPAVLFGGIYDWYEPILAIEAVALAKRRIAAITLTFTRHPNAEITPQSKFAEAMRYAGTRGYEFVRAEPWVPYAEREAFYDQFGIALLTFIPSLETDLALRTRAFDYLWAGLPVVSSSAPGTDSLIRSYNAGTVVELSDAAAYAEELVRLLSDRATYEAKVAGTQAYAAEHQWPRLLEPLLAFCRAPRVDETKQLFARARSGLPRRSIIGRIRNKLGA